MPQPMGNQTLKIEDARYILTVDPQRRIIEDGSILIDGPRIARVGKASELRPPPGPSGHRCQGDGGDAGLRQRPHPHQLRPRHPGHIPRRPGPRLFPQCLQAPVGPHRGGGVLRLAAGHHRAPEVRDHLSAGPRHHQVPGRVHAGLRGVGVQDRRRATRHRPARPAARPRLLDDAGRRADGGDSQEVRRKARWQAPSVGDSPVHGVLLPGAAGGGQEAGGRVRHGHDPPPDQHRPGGGGSRFGGTASGPSSTWRK